jgi:hypothetical protein
VSKRVIALLAGALAIALIVAGCGGGNGNSTGTASISKAEFEKKGNAICASGEKRVNAEVEEYVRENHLTTQKPTQAQMTEIANTIAIPSIQRQIDEIRALGAPAGEEEQVSEVLAAVEEALEEIKQDPAKIMESESQVPAFAKANRLARGLGLDVCGEEG